MSHIPTMMKRGSYTLVEEDPKNIYKSRDTTADISIFLWISETFVLSRNADIDCILILKF